MHPRAMRQDGDTDARPLRVRQAAAAPADIMQACVGALHRSIVEDRAAAGRADVLQSLSALKVRKRADGSAVS